MTENNKYTHIRELLDRFFDGDTTCAQERELEQFFASAPELPADLEQYREMFGWYAAGMPEEEERGAVTAAEKPSTRLLNWRPWLAWGAAAVVAAVIITVGWNRRSNADDSELIYADSYVIRNGIVITGADEVNPEIEAARIEMALLDKALDNETENIDPYINEIL